MTHHLSIDIETFSDVDIGKTGLYKYAQQPAFDILLIAWVKDDGEVHIIDLVSGGDPAEFLRVLADESCLLHAYNAAFEHYCINTWLKRMDMPEIPLSRWRCTMAHGLYCGYTAGLAATGDAMGLPNDKKKLSIGSALIRKFCLPQKTHSPAPLLEAAGLDIDRTKQDTLSYVRSLIRAEPEKWNLFKEYCMQDVETEREIGRRLRKWPMPEREQKLWELTCEANMEGVGVDRDLVASALAMGEAEQAQMLSEAREISGLDNPKSVQQLMKWLNKELDTDEETEITDLRKATVSELLAAGVDSSRAARMLELRQLMSKTSTKKYDALDAAVCGDGRVRGMLFYYGANRSGRWAGRIVQPQNLPQNHIDSLPFARERVKARDTEMVKVCWGSVPDTLSQLIRTAFIPSPGKLYAVADYSAIEARVVAWLAGEKWVLDAFRAGQDIYCATASQMFGVPVEKHGVNADLRQKGKIAVLALGYGGSEGALIQMGAVKMGIPEEDLTEIKMKWRQANPRICALWRTVEDAAMNVMTRGAQVTIPIKTVDPARARENEMITGAAAGSYSDRFNSGAFLIFSREADPDTSQDFLTVKLPTGRKLFYAQPYLAPSKKSPEKDALHYYSVNQNTKKWSPTDTWGGKLVENITQAVARDCLAETLIRMREVGLIACFHVHDEVIVEIDRDEQLQDILDIMAAPIDWAPGLPLRGAGFTCRYYQKD